MAHSLEPDEIIMNNAVLSSSQSKNTHNMQLRRICDTVLAHCRDRNEAVASREVKKWRDFSKGRISFEMMSAVRCMYREETFFLRNNNLQSVTKRHAFTLHPKHHLPVLVAQQQLHFVINSWIQSLRDFSLHSLNSYCGTNSRASTSSTDIEHYLPAL
eukprot:12155925-Ditylum_brightwellii.AAC.1